MNSVLRGLPNPIVFLSTTNAGSFILYIESLSHLSLAARNHASSNTRFILTIRPTHPMQVLNDHTKPRTAVAHLIINICLPRKERLLFQWYILFATKMRKRSCNTKPNYAYRLTNLGSGSGDPIVSFSARGLVRF